MFGVIEAGRHRRNMFGVIEAGGFQIGSKFSFVLLLSDETSSLALLLVNIDLVVFQNLFGLSLSSVNND